MEHRGKSSYISGSALSRFAYFDIDKCAGSMFSPCDDPSIPHLPRSKPPASWPSPKLSEKDSESSLASSSQGPLSPSKRRVPTVELSDGAMLVAGRSAESCVLACARVDKLCVQMTKSSRQAGLLVGGTKTLRGWSVLNTCKNMQRLFGRLPCQLGYLLTPGQPSAGAERIYLSVNVSQALCATAGDGPSDSQQTHGSRGCYCQ